MSLSIPMSTGSSPNVPTSLPFRNPSNAVNRPSFNNGGSCGGPYPSSQSSKQQSGTSRKAPPKVAPYDPEKRRNSACHLCDHAAKRNMRLKIALQVPCCALDCRKVFCSRQACIKKLGRIGVTDDDSFEKWKQRVESGKEIFVCPHCTDESSCPGPQCSRRLTKRKSAMPLALDDVSASQVAKALLSGNFEHIGVDRALKSSRRSGDINATSTGTNSAAPDAATGSASCSPSGSRQSASVSSHRRSSGTSATGTNKPSLTPAKASLSRTALPWTNVHDHLQHLLDSVRSGSKTSK